MTQPGNNRMATPQNRGRGRPPNDRPTPPSIPAEIDTTQRHVPPISNPPCCGRGNTPKVLRWRTVQNRQVADCQCNACGSTFEYEPATVRPKTGK